ncbi:MAG: ABC transporter permease [Solirubrobacterales bacterium]
MRWLLLKDLQILRRSPLIVALLVVYPVALGVLIGFALSGDDSKPRVAFLNLVPPGEALGLGPEEGGDEFGSDEAREQLCARVDCVDTDSRAEAEEKVSDGEVLGALILPPDLVDKLRSLTGLAPEQPTVEVLVNEDDPIKAELVDDRIQALVTEANLILSQRVSAQAADYLDLLVEGGRFEIPLLGGVVEILGLERTERILEDVRADLPPPARELVDRVIEFAGIAGENLDLALPLLGAVAEPIAVEKEVLTGETSELDSFAIAVAATVTLMFVTVLLVAGSLALEREENAFARITRGLVGKTGVLAEKIVLGIVASLVVTLLMLAVLTALVSIDWGRALLILAAIFAGGAGFAAFGAAIGSAAREVRAGSLLAFTISLPIAFLSLVPSGTVSGGVYDAIEVVTALFPFAPALDALEGALDSAGPELWPAAFHLLAMVAAYGALARLALRRFA